MPDDAKSFPPTPEMAARAHADRATYDAMYARSIEDPEGFWAEHGRQIDWMTPFTEVKNTSFAPGDISIEWFRDGQLNVSANCVDRHLAKRGDQTAIIWEPDDPNAVDGGGAQHITYRQLHAHVCKFANVLKAMGVGRGRPL